MYGYRSLKAPCPTQSSLLQCAIHSTYLLKIRSQVGNHLRLGKSFSSQLYSSQSVVLGHEQMWRCLLELHLHFADFLHVQNRARPRRNVSFKHAWSSLVFDLIFQWLRILGTWQLWPSRIRHSDHRPQSHHFNGSSSPFWLPAECELLSTTEINRTGCNARLWPWISTCAFSHRFWPLTRIN